MRRRNMNSIATGFPPPPKLYQCSTCELYCETEELLKAHLERPHCPQCLRDFANAAALKRHKTRIHDDA